MLAGRPTWNRKTSDVRTGYCRIFWVVYREQMGYARGYEAFMRVNLQAKDGESLPNLPDGGQGAGCGA